MQAIKTGLPSNADGESSVFPVAVFDDGHFASQEASGPVEDLMSVSMVRRAACVRVRGVVVRMAVRHHVWCL